VDSTYFLRLLNFIGEGATAANKDGKLKLIKARRELFVAKDDLEYE